MNPRQHTRPIKVCFIAGTLGRGGAERQLVYMLRSLKDHGITPRVLTLTHGQPLQREIEDLGVSVEWVGTHPSPASRLRRIVMSLRREPADIVQSIHFYTNLYAAISAAVTRKSSIGAIRGEPLEALRANRVFGPADLLLPDYLLVNSRPAYEFARSRRRSSSRVMLLRNAVDVARFRDTRAQATAHGPDSLRLLFVGRLSAEKRADRFLRLLDLLRRRWPHRAIEACLAGDGPDRGTLETFGASLGLDADQVRFLGEVDDTAPLYAWADILVLTSDHEGTPNVILEAMAAGVPVVATTVGGVPDVLSSGGGLLVRPGSDEMLAAAVMRLATDPALVDRLVEQGSRYLLRNHSLASLGEQLAATYAHAVTTRRYGGM